MSDDALAPRTLREAVIDPFVEFFSRDGLMAGLAILAFLFLYKLGDNMATALATPFYLDMGYSLTEIGSVAKVAGLWASIAGGTLGGIIMLKLSINRALWLFGFVQMFTILPFVWLSQAGHTLMGLFLVVSGEYLGVGLGSGRADGLHGQGNEQGLYRHPIRPVQQLHRGSRARLPMPRPASSSKPSVGRSSSSSAPSPPYPGMLLLLKVAPWTEKEEKKRDAERAPQRRDDARRELTSACADLTAAASVPSSR